MAHLQHALMLLSPHSYSGSRGDVVDMATRYGLDGPRFEPMLIAVAVRSKAWVCCHSLAGIVGSNPAGSMDVYVVFVV